MQKYLVKKEGGEQEAGKRAAGVPARKKQLKLSECRKVVTLQNCSGVGRSLESLQAAQRVLAAAFAEAGGEEGAEGGAAEEVTDEEVLLALRTLSSMQISKQDLLDHPLGAPVRRARRHANPEVRQLAEKLIEKWKAVVVRQERSSGSSRARDFFGGLKAR